MSKEGRLGLATAFLQWKGTDACYDFYCSCSPEEPQHFDGMFGEQFTCGSTADEDSELPDGGFCGKTWRLPFNLSAIEVPDER
ncbi:MAG TPA: hypothetical protein VGA04_08525 [Streptosporangiaceae bacterium]